MLTETSPQTIARAAHRGRGFWLFSMASEHEGGAAWTSLVSALVSIQKHTKSGRASIGIVASVMLQFISRTCMRLLPAALLITTTVAAVACGDRRSAAAEVSKEDVRRLPPERKAMLPDITIQAADRGRVLGDSAHAQILVISDYQCASCRQWFEQTLPVLRRTYVDTHQATITWVHYPLREHPNAVRAANVAMCTAVEGKFWEASARLFAAVDRWSNAPDAKAIIDSIGGSTGVDAMTFYDCVKSGRILRQIRGDIDWVDQGKQGQPLTVVVGTRRLASTASIGTLKATIDSVLAGK